VNEPSESSKSNDFTLFRNALLGNGDAKRLPLCELHVDLPVKQAFLSRPIESMRDEVDFWVRAGYDYVPLSAGLVRVAGVLGGTAVSRPYSVYGDGEMEVTWAPEHQGPIATLADVEAFDWPHPDALDLSHFEQAAAHLPPNMRIIAVIGKIFTATWMLLGFERFAIASVEQPKLIAEVFERVAEIQTRVCERCLEFPFVGGLWMSDDIAYAQGLMVSPKLLRQHVFSHYRRIGEKCHQGGVLFIYHSDGDLTQVMRDIVECGFHGLHPIEPKAMDSRLLKHQWGKHLAVLGNVDLDILARGTPEQVRAYTEANLRDLGYDGRYGVGSSNSVTYYVPLANYLAMRDAVLAWRR
jgi:uroporphyrinogen decarboxylase